jgi:hypothetical protein
MTIPALKAETRVELRASFVIFPDLVKARLPRLAGQSPLLVDVTLSIAVEFEKSGLLSPIPAIG